MKCSCDQNQMSKRCNWWTTDRLNKRISWILIHRYKPCKHDKHSNHNVDNSSVTPEQCCQKMPQKRDLCITFNGASYEPPCYFGRCWNTSQKVWTFPKKRAFHSEVFPLPVHPWRVVTKKFKETLGATLFTIALHPSMKSLRNWLNFFWSADACKTQKMLP